MMNRLRHVTVYHAADCGLCARALQVVQEVRAEVAYELEVVDISGSAELEERYRESLPVVEIDGAVAFRYFVDADALRERVRTVPPTRPEDPQAES